MAQRELQLAHTQLAEDKVSGGQRVDRTIHISDICKHFHRLHLPSAPPLPNISPAIRLPDRPAWMPFSSDKLSSSLAWAS